MNLIDAIKKALEKKVGIKHTGYVDIAYRSLIANPHLSLFSHCQVLSEDWELEEKTITITESQFDEAVLIRSTEANHDQRKIVSYCDVDELKQRLFGGKKQ